MFSRPGENGHTAPKPPPAAETARIQGGGLVHLLVSGVDPLLFHLFLNGKPVPQGEVESLLVSIEAPPDDASAGPTARCTLNRYVADVAGDTGLQQQELFPCTVEIIVRGRRIGISCPERDSLDGLWISLGLRPDGSGNEISGARALRFFLSDGILDARLTWVDGETESLLG